MPRRRTLLPTLRRHKARGLGVVTVRLADGSRRSIYLGPWPADCRNPPPEVVAEYNRVVAKLAADGGALPCPAGSDVTIIELVARYCDHVERHCRRPHGTPTGQAGNIRDALWILREMYSNLPGKDFSPLKLKAVRELMVAGGLARRTVTEQHDSGVSLWFWAATERSRAFASRVCGWGRGVRPAGRRVRPATAPRSASAAGSPPA